jgi:hypothetical protein
MPPAYEVLLLNTAVPQIQAAQSGDTYVVPRDIAFSAALTLSAGTANGVPYLSSPGKVLTTGSALTFDGTDVGIGGAPVSGLPLRLLRTSSGAQIRYQNTAATWDSGVTAAGDYEIFSAANTSIQFGLNSSERMRLTSTGLGIGTNNPAAKLQVLGSGQGTIFGSSSAQNFYSTWQYNSTNVGYIGNGASIVGAAAATDFGLTAFTGGKLWLGTNNGASYAVIDSSGNLGLGVTPSAWNTGKAFEINAVGTGLWGAFGNTYLNANNYYNAADKFAGTGYAVRYLQVPSNGQHQWLVSTTSGTAGNAISFTQAMTLDASGMLLVGTTAQGTYGGNTVEFRGANIATPGSNVTGNLALFTTDSQAANVGAVLSLGGVYASTTPYAFGAIAARKSNSTSGNAEGYLQFYTTASDNGIVERARITSGGYFKASNDGNYAGVSVAYHELYQSADADTVRIRGANAAFSNNVLFVGADRNTTNGSFNAIAYYNFGASAYRFYVADSGNVTNTNGTYGTISDAKMKTDIVDAGSQWSDIKALRFRKFKMKDDPSGLVQLGVVAQEVELTSPGLVDEHADKDAEGNDLGTTTKSVKTSVLLMKAAVALQEAMARIEKLEAEVAALKGA